MKKILPILLIMNIFLMTGCWDAVELNSIGIVAAVGFDLDNESGKIIVTSQVVKAEEMKKKQAKTKEQSPVVIAVDKGTSVFEAISNTSEVLDKKLLFSHLKVVVIGESLAEKGLIPIIDPLQRGYQFPPLAWIVIAKGTTAQKILGIKSGLENIQASYMENIIKNSDINSTSSLATSIDFAKKILGAGINPSAGVVEAFQIKQTPVEDGKVAKALRISGGAVFIDDKLIGYMNEKDVSAYNYVIGKMKGTIIKVPSIINENALVSVRIQKVKSKIIPKIENGHISFTVKIEQAGSLVSNHAAYGKLTNLSHLKLVTQLQDECSKVTRDQVDSTICKLQNEFRSDIFGFGSALGRKYPKEWDEIKDSWGKIFPSVEYTMSVVTIIKRTGLTLGPISPKE